LSEVTYEIVVHTHEQTVDVRAPEAIKGILQDVLDNTTQYVKDSRGQRECEEAT
jgi:hypothetical protein